MDLEVGFTQDNNRPPSIKLCADDSNQVLHFFVMRTFPIYSVAGITFPKLGKVINGVLLKPM
jgi:hypothetical protein